MHLQNRFCVATQPEVCLVNYILFKKTMLKKQKILFKKQKLCSKNKTIYDTSIYMHLRN